MHRLAAEFGPPDQFGLVSREGFHQRLQAAAELARGFGGIGRESAGFGRPSFLPGGGGAAGAHVIDEGVAEQLIKPRHEALVVAQLVGRREGLGESLLQQVLGVGVVAAEARGEEAAEFGAAGEQGFELGGAVHECRDLCLYASAVKSTSLNLAMSAARTATLARKTAETDIQLRLVVDGSGRSNIATGVPFFDHMLTLFAKHGHFDLDVTCKGDVAVDYHHTVEDIGIVLGDAFKQALGDKRGIVRYGFFYVPMDEALARVVVDLSGRAALVYDVVAPTMYVRDFNLILVKEFCRAFSNSLACNLHVKLDYGEEPHHVAEAIFKALARALDAAVTIDPRWADQIPSTKGVI